jgi:hypothetical protein
MQTINPARFDAYLRLLAEPDPADLPRRSHVPRYAGDPNRPATRLPGILMAWLQRRHLMVDPEQPLAQATPMGKRDRRPSSSGLHLLRPTGTG